MPVPPATLLLATPRLREAGRLDWPGGPDLPEPSTDGVIAALDGIGGGPVWLGGGEPTLRPDLPRLVERLAARGDPGGLDTDGLALASPRVASSLERLGLRRVRIALHAGRADAHDWLVGLPGAAKRARQAITACAQAGLAVEVAVTITRPTMDLLPETVGLAARLGASSVRLRRLRRRGPATHAFVTLSARIGLLEPFLEAAVQRALDAGLSASVEGFPRCAAVRVAAHRVAREAVVAPAGLAPLVDLLAEPAAAPGCPTCPGDATCPGAPADYVERFGRTEIDSETGMPRRRPTPRPLPRGALPTAPPPRAGRAPATRLRDVRRLAAAPDLGGDPVGGTAPAAPNDEVVLVLDASRDSRWHRQRMVQLAQEGAETLVVTGDLSHPDAHELLRDALRLSQPRVVLRGDVRPLSGLSSRQRVALRQLAAVEPVDLDGVAAHAENQAVADALRAALSRGQ